MQNTMLANLIAIHIVCDWFLQNEWMATNKNNPKHIAGYVHAGIHGLGCLIVLPWQFALFVAVAHWLIDLRLIIPAWRKLYKQGGTPEVMMHMSFWQDQSLHFLVLFGISKFF